MCDHRDAEFSRLARDRLQNRVVELRATASAIWRVAVYGLDGVNSGVHQFTDCCACRLWIRGLLDCLSTKKVVSAGSRRCPWSGERRAHDQQSRTIALAGIHGLLGA
jgi:hypothetical protein